MSEFEIVETPITDVVPYENNPRLNKDAVEHVRNSISEFGFLVPIVVDSSNVVITGHTRLLAALELGHETISVIQAPHLTDEQVKAFRIADNKVSEYAGWDEALLEQELQELRDMGFDLEYTGFSKEELDCLVGDVGADCLDDLDLESVCGDVKVADIENKMGVNFGMGGYNLRMSVEDFHRWETHMLGKYGGKLGVRKELFKRLDISKFIKSPESDAMMLKKAIIVDNKQAKKDLKKKDSPPPKKTTPKKKTLIKKKSKK